MQPNASLQRDKCFRNEYETISLSIFPSWGCFEASNPQKKVFGMRGLIVSDDIGLVKVVNLQSKSTNYVSNASGPDMNVVSMCSPGNIPTRIAVARNSGVVDVYESTTESAGWKQVRSYELDESPIRMLPVDGSLLVGSETSFKSLALDYDKKQECSLPSGPYSFLDLMPTAEGIAANPKFMLAAHGNACPVIIDLGKMSIVWTGRNASDTPIGLSSTFTTNCLLGLTDKIFVAGDLSGKLRFYDISMQRKPVLEMPVFEIFTLTNNYTGTSGMGQTRPIQKLTLSPDKSTLFFGDTFGSVVGLNVSKIVSENGLPSPEAKIGTLRHKEACKKLIPMVCGFKGVMGSVRDIAVTDEYVYVVSAGRYAYAFERKSKGKKFDKMFLNQKLTACLPYTIEINSGDDEPQPVTDEISDDEEIDAGADETLELLEEKEDARPVSKSKRRRMRKGASKNN